MSNPVRATDTSGLEIAIIGLSGRFPGARNLDEFWQNLREGRETISFFTTEELEASGVNPAWINAPNYVRARGILEDIEMFDASLFGINRREAEITDPQHRLFLESVWEALENSGYEPGRYEGSIGLFAGVGTDTYFLANILSNAEVLSSVSDMQILIGNYKDFFATRVSYKLNLRGPSVVVQSACSTALVSLHLACQSLLSGDCDMALAGGVAVRVPQKIGYLHEEGGIGSPDGHCRPFDAEAQGTVGSNGAGVVVLKRLSDALSDGDHIHAIVKGSALNNDGSMKVGFTAPSIQAQAQVIAHAQGIARTSPETITMIEAHGTGTILGDPVEFAALSQAFSAGTQKKGFCALGSIKANIGHCDAAAGVASLIKTILALRHKMIPPSRYFKSANPQIDFSNSPFYVNTSLSEWKEGPTPRRAGVSSFGMGGTNAHVILEEAPARADAGRRKPWSLLTLSAKTESALEVVTSRLADYLVLHPEYDLANVAYTLQVGRKAFKNRRTVVCSGIDDAVSALKGRNGRVRQRAQAAEGRQVIFMFPGQGTQYLRMGFELYQQEPAFRKYVDRCSELLLPHIGADLRDLLYPENDRAGEAAQVLKQTLITQPAIFVIEYALAKLLMEWGVHPQLMIGHSIGEYVAACLAKVLSLEDALTVVAARGRLMQSLPEGSMLVVPLPEVEVQPLLNEHVSIAAINSPSLCVVSGQVSAVTAFKESLAQRGVVCNQLHTSHAFHSAMMDPALEPFEEEVSRIKLSPPQIPYVSCVTGTLIRTAEATDPHYWAVHMRRTVRFAEGAQELFRHPDAVLLEVGPGRTLNSLVEQNPNKPVGQVALGCLHLTNERQSDEWSLLEAIGQLWLAGVQIDWAKACADDRRCRVPLPTYPFERKRFWVEPSPTNDVNHPAVNLVEETPFTGTSLPLEVTDAMAPPSSVGSFGNQPSQTTPDVEEVSAELEHLFSQQLQFLYRQLDLLQNE